MRLDQLLPKRLRAIGPEMVKFGIIGGLNVVVNAAAFNLLLLLPIFADGQLKAKVVATAVAIVSSYFMNRHWTYRDRDKSAAHREFMLFVGFNLAGLLIELAVMGVTKYLFGLTSWLALNAAVFIGLALGTVFRFLTYRRFVFTHAPAPAAVALPAQAGSLEQELEELEEFEELTAPLEKELLEKELGRKVDPAPAKLG